MNKILKPRRYLFLIAALSIIICVFFLVHYGRAIQNDLRAFRSSWPITFNLLATIGFLSTSILIGYQALILFHKSRRALTYQLILLLIVLAFIVRHIDGMWIELSHLFIYGGFYIAIRCYIALISESKFLGIFVAMFMSISLSLIDEYLQHLHPARIGDLRDIILNLTSSTVGAILIEPHVKSSKD